MPPHPFGAPFFQPSAANGAYDFEDALKEAIQRSLQERQLKEHIKEMKEKLSSQTEQVKVEGPIPELIKDTPSPVVVSVESSPEPAEPEPMETEPTTGEEDHSTASKAVKVLLEIKEASTAASTENEEESFGDEDEIVVDPEDDDSDDEAIHVETVDAADKSDDGSLVEQFDPLTAGPSFSSDAAGNGDVAEALGHTLDQCARAIDAMVSELNRSDSRTSDASQDQDDDDSDFPPNQGATILESVDDENKQQQPKDDEKSEDGWQVVTESQQITEDEALARAAQFVGSALFNSDISARSAVMSTLSGSGGSLSTNLSSIPTLPSVVPSITPSAGEEASAIPTAQLQRWAVQLKQLHELGFHDEKVNIAILERMSAANVGADLFEEISVTQVVNALLNGKME